MMLSESLYSPEYAHADGDDASAWQPKLRSDSA